MTSISYDALRAVPAAYREGMLAVGATPWQAVRMVVLPAAKSGILAAAILSMGRAVGETMAVIMVAGNATIVPTSLLDPVRTMTSKHRPGNGLCLRTPQVGAVAPVWSCSSSSAC